MKWSNFICLIIFKIICAIHHELNIIYYQQDSLVTIKTSFSKKLYANLPPMRLSNNYIHIYH